MAVSLWMQRGLWGLGETVWNRLQGHRKQSAGTVVTPSGAAVPAKGEQA